ncbi:hypothetical protein A3B45_05040 [Candidatus Daviesbacteria bacterium RIFCSPLOWO2_01_FULL_39_12]|uniref:Thioredoxin domain-containing protein n=1 Tax=Candidatus Daviesbacteria bacterium RIFCSPLOWO2_01_FULL_39_12 TaxID=1797785 RepID=A0A1F5KU96_9BACT|nr:MAG: hypothetical protein A3D79_01735 [Candidatus Daviesbacteria bacterium RIFCSPHIGHO2_02_FULL_39_8]OGE44486.1 MAG: hypothetical protein A3B45_05040 [Candidatus Daviesbacteria bacterium RIFCSPLOWO2_01_FULL_39_12]
MKIKQSSSIKKVIFVLIILGVVFLAGYLILQKKTPVANTGNQTSSTSSNLNAFAQCLSEKGVKMYGSYICSACAAQKKGLGEAYQYIDYVECHPNGPNPQTDLCLKRNITKTPTWILEKDGAVVKRLEGFQSHEDLASFSGCKL